MLPTDFDQSWNSAVRFSRELTRHARFKIKSVVAFGSVTRPSDFVDGLSDIDLLVIASPKPRGLEKKVKAIARTVNCRISPVIYSPTEFRANLRKGDPGSLLMLNGKILHDTGYFAKTLESGFEPTKKTFEAVVSHAFHALSLAFNDYFSGSDIPESINQAYHCARHSVRAIILKEKEKLLESNGEIFAELMQYRQVKETFSRLVEARVDMKRLSESFDPESACKISSALIDNVGQLLLLAEKAAIDACRFCFGKNVHSIRNAIMKLDQGSRMEIFGFSWDNFNWMISVRSDDKHSFWVYDSLKDLLKKSIRARKLAGRPAAN